MTALVIAAHGSHYHAGTAQPAWAITDTIRQSGLFDEVTAAFWKEQPSLGTVLENLNAQVVTVVPLFASEGYFSQAVLPAELQPRPDQQITITPAIGPHPTLTTIVSRRIASALATISSQQVSIVVVGHGTPRHPNSTNATEHQATRLRESGDFGEVLTAYLDEEPRIGDVYTMVNFPTVVVVPFFIAEGLHTQDDIPAALGLEPPYYDPQTVQGHCVIYTPPVGLEVELYQVVLALAGKNPDTPLNGSVWDAIPISTNLLQVVEQTEVGEVWLGHADYLCHKDDQHTPPHRLINLETPSAIRDYLRVDATGKFRPLASTRTLRHGWRSAATEPTRRAAILETIYPALGASGSPRSVGQVAARQQGKYRPVRQLNAQQIEALVDTHCQQCIRHPHWHTTAHATPSSPLCLEPCSIWLEAAIR